jgi:hypothetical protein
MIIGLLWPVSVFSKTYDLSEPDELHAVPTVLKAVHGLSVLKNRLFFFGYGQEDYVESTILPEGKTREGRFGRYGDNKRIANPKTKYPGEWRGILKEDEKHRILWDASMLQIVRISLKDNSVAEEATVPVDLLSPPEDRIGKATQYETKIARKKFKAAYKKLFGPRYTGLVPLPKKWERASEKDRYLIATKIESFPLIVLACDAKDPMNCMMERFCSLDDHFSVDAPDVRGVAADPESKTLVVGDSKTNILHFFKWSSCMKIDYRYSLKLPKLVQTMTSVHIDESKRLWVTTGKWEYKYDSNVYYWEQQEWMKP